MRLTLVAILLASCASAQAASPLAWLIDDMKTTFARNNCWPRPFIDAEPAHVAAPFSAMTQKGWEQQNMLGAHHFEPESQELTEAGVIKLRWILTQAPPQHRTAFVERDLDPAMTAQRMAAVQTAADAIAVDGAPSVQESQLVSHGSSGAHFDAVYQKFVGSTPDPRLPAATPSSSSGSP